MKMGLFFDSPDEKALRDSIDLVAQLVGKVQEGSFSGADLNELLDSERPKLQCLYDAVATSKSPRAARKILDASYEIANIWAGGNARALMRQVLESLDRPL